MTSGLAKECSCAMATSDLNPCLAAEFVAICHCAAAFFLQVSKSCTTLDLTFLYISMWETYSKLVRKNSIPTLRAAAFASRSHARAMSAGLPRHDHVSIPTEQLVRFYKNEFDEVLCKLNSTAYTCSFKPNPT